MKKCRPSGLDPTRTHQEGPDRPATEANCKPGLDPLLEIKRLNQELQTHQVQLEAQNALLLETQTALEGALAKLKSLYDFAPIGYLTLDREGTILGLNLPGASLMGTDRSQMVGQPLISFLDGTHPPLEEFLERVFLRHERASCEATLKSARGVARYIRIEGVADILDDTCLAALVDLTDLRQEQMLRLQVESIEDYAICLLDAEGKILDWNAGAERLEGYQAEEIIGKNFSCLYQEKDREDGKPEEELRKAAAKGRFEEECWRIRKDGSGFWADVVLTPLRDQNGNLWGFSKVTHDITGRRRAEDALRDSEARYRTLFEANPVMIFTLGPEWTIRSVNRSGASQLGYLPEELEGKSVLDFSHPEDHAGVVQQLQQCLRNPARVLRWQFRKLRRDGRVLWVEETAQAIQGLEGGYNILMVCQDVTGRKLAEDEREKLLTQLEAVLNSITEGVVISDLEGNVLTMNPAALTLNGFSSIEEVRLGLDLYQELFQLCDLDGTSLPVEQWPLARALKRERFTDYELQVRRRDTGKTWVGSFSGTPVYTRDGDLILCVVTFRDVTERKQAEEALVRSEERFAKIFQSVPVFVAITTVAEGRCVDANDRGLQILGYRREEVLGKTFVELGVWENKEVREHMIDSLEEGGSVRDIEITFRDRDRKLHTGLYAADFIYLNGERYVISVVNDITERKEMEVEIAELSADLAGRAGELVAVNEELEAFNYTVAHDLRQPLNIISTACQVLERLCGDQLGEECKEYLHLAYKNTARMDDLIAALLRFSRMGQVEPHREMVDLSAIAQEVIATLRLTEPERQAECRIAEGMVANCDAGLMRTVLDNLLGNAWKYTRGKEKTEIEFGVRDINGVPTYYVKDNGAGFEMADAQRLYTPFQRLPAAEKERGFGIGLATVERVIRRHGGTVCAEGSPGKGATFFFTLSS